MNNNPTITPQVVNSPFTNFCMSIGAIPTSYKDSLDYYETLLWLIKFLDETVIPAVNNNGNAVAELQTLYVELKDYVERYFDNLDVQEEINNKLDEMASDGTLESIISEYVKLSIFINTSTYEYYDDVSDTKYYIVEIPKEDLNGNENTIKLGIPHDDTSLVSSESTIDFAIDKTASVCINGGIGSSNNPQKPHGIVIQNGVVLKDAVYTTLRADGLGIKEDGSFMTFDASNTTAQQLLDLGVVNALVGWGAIIVNGVSIQPVFSNANETNPRQVICRKTNGDYLIFTCDGRLEDNIGMTISDVQRILQAYGNIDFAYNLDGGGSTSTVVDLQKINIDIDNHYEDRPVYTFLYFKKEPPLDNPDSKELFSLISKLRQKVIKNQATGEVLNGKLKLFSDDSYPEIEFYSNGNRSVYDGSIRINNQGFTCRQVDNREDNDRILFSVTSSYFRYLGNAFGKFFGYAANNGTTYDLNDIKEGGLYYANNSTANTPDTGYYIILVLPNSEYSKNITQIAFPFSDTNKYIYVRRSTVPNNVFTWNEWQVMGAVSATSDNRPTINLKNGCYYFDTTLNKPLWFKAGNWYDAMGNKVY